ncbi:leucine carboxyl methyltransferase family [Talaromyces proteolyticus]|uniref:tRNA wybutosine-synthesizing protein 4 n=1 Tax=Talaromyces proteolyticus TaxID=1131652 RepID=A0AAD4L1X0_9EURO|nr:leucine carboxyl methyltransferase family [Talaromyces proteolyticus]KAH8705111.1 leucine carboxyl methyltransferase family [Talaromyces proteolyticus]
MAQKPKQATASMPTKQEKEAGLVMETNNSSIVSKRSVELQYYPGEEFFRPFVKRPQRRAPLINRGYWLRMHAIAQTVRKFLEEPHERPKFILNLGCGYDPLPFQFLAREKAICQNATFVDIDYEKLMGIKTTLIQKTDVFKDVLGKMDIYPEPNPVLLRASHYVAVGCDLKNLKKLGEGLNEIFGSSPVSILCTAEVSLTYMDIESADALVSWLPTLGQDIQFCLLEQFFPDGPNHPFAYTMMKHFHKLQAPLHSIHKYPTLQMQEERFTSKGWLSASAMSLWNVWNDDSFLSKSQRTGLDDIEPFDEWEEFSLFASHYFLLSASTFARDYRNKNPEAPCSNGLPKSSLVLSAKPLPTQKGRRRFAAIVSDSDGSLGIHGGLGSQYRLSSTDLYVRGEKVTKSVRTLPPQNIPPRMCHTITNLKDGRSLIVGGRASPAASLSDCWIRQDNVWKETYPLPVPRFRHCATHVQLQEDAEHVLVYGGKSNKGETLGDWLLWDVQQGWQTLEVVSEADIPTRFGASIVSIGSSSGYLFGGMTQDGIIQTDFWKWTVKVRESGTKIIQLIEHTSKLRDATTLSDYIGRFGASVSVISDSLIIIGGISVRGILTHELEILHLNIAELAQEKWNSLTVEIVHYVTDSSMSRPLLVGHVSSNVSPSEALVATGGAVCFSFGTYWNDFIWHLRDISVRTPVEWNLLPENEKACLNKPAPLANKIRKRLANPGTITAIPRRTVETQTEFEEIMAHSQPVIIAGANLGRCTEYWTKDYLAQAMGVDRQVIVHEARSDHMNFQTKNFSYKTKKFSTFLEEIHQGSRQYLRSISVNQPTKKATNLAEDFPEIKDDFQLPAPLSFVQEHAHSSPLRISGPVTMWLHYDVMGNVYCQIQGQKKLVLYPPSDVQHLQLPAGASSSTLEVFDSVADGNILYIPRTSPHEAIMKPGDILFIPPLWLHAASPIGGVSIAVNMFFRNLVTGYATGRDVYANRDLQAYEKGRNEVDKIAQSFKALPPDMAQFYLLRLADELRAKAQR